MTDNDGWKKISGAKTDTWNPEQQKEILGVYVDKKVGVGKYQKNVYVLEMPDGTRKGVWGSAQIERALGSVEFGYEVRIIYMGKVQNPTTGQTSNSFEFFIRKPKTSTTPTQPAQTEKKDDDLPF